MNGTEETAQSFNSWLRVGAPSAAAVTSSGASASPRADDSRRRSPHFVSPAVRCLTTANPEAHRSDVWEEENEERTQVAQDGDEEGKQYEKDLTPRFRSDILEDEQGATPNARSYTTHQKVGR